MGETYVIDKTGTVQMVFNSQFKPEEHVEKALATAASYQGGRQGSLLDSLKAAQEASRRALAASALRSDSLADMLHSRAVDSSPSAGPEASIISNSHPLLEEKARHLPVTGIRSRQGACANCPLSVVVNVHIRNISYVAPMHALSQQVMLLAASPQMSRVTNHLDFSAFVSAATSALRACWVRTFINIQRVRGKKGMVTTQ